MRPSPWCLPPGTAQGQGRSLGERAARPPPPPQGSSPLAASPRGGGATCCPLGGVHVETAETPPSPRGSDVAGPGQQTCAQVPGSGVSGPLTLES